MQLDQPYMLVIEVFQKFAFFFRNKFLNRRHRVFFSQAVAQGVTPGNLPADKTVLEPIDIFRIIGIFDQKQYLTGQRPGIIDNGPPDDPRLPPPVIGLIGPECQQQGNNGAQHGRNRHRNGNIGDMEILIYDFNRQTIDRHKQYFVFDFPEDIFYRNVLF